MLVFDIETNGLYADVTKLFCLSVYDTDTETHCVKCGSTDVDYGTRVIGYLKRISNFSEARQREAGKRFYHHLKK